MKRYYLYILIFFLLSGCNSNRQKIQEIVNHWSGREIIFTDSLSMKIFGRDTCADIMAAHKYKILNYIDTSGCGECQLRFYDWRRIQYQIDSLQADVSIVYIVFVKDYMPIELSQKVNKAD